MTSCSGHTIAISSFKFSISSCTNLRPNFPASCTCSWTIASGENKYGYVLGYCALLVQRSVFKKVYSICTLHFYISIIFVLYKLLSLWYRSVWIFCQQVIHMKILTNSFPKCPIDWTRRELKLLKVLIMLLTEFKNYVRRVALFLLYHRPAKGDSLEHHTWANCCYSTWDSGHQNLDQVFIRGHSWPLDPTLFQVSKECNRSCDRV